MDLLNKGVIRLHGQPEPSEPTAAQRTVIVSGVARSGTSMVARVLRAAGLYMGEQLDDVVFEDSAFALLFEHGYCDPDALAALVRRRNAAHRVWGFKRPHLHMHGAHLIGAFRKPRVILTVRDPVAIAQRNAIAEQFDARTGIGDAATDLQQLVAFAGQLSCPVLLLSYEKAVCMPDAFVEQVLSFSGLEASAAVRRKLSQLVEPNRPAYVGAARRVFEGYVDRIDGTVLCGWAWQKGVPLPVQVTLLRDGVPVSDHIADLRRQDLVDSAIGSGHHGFEIDLAGHGFTPSSRVAVKIGGRSFALNNSGSTVAELGGWPSHN